MKILMLETRRGTEDGFTVQQYIKGKTYDVRPHLAFAFIVCGNATAVKSQRYDDHLKQNHQLEVSE